MYTKLSGQRGFTLTEIVIVVIIVGILAASIIPRFTGTMERVRASEGVQMLIALLGAQRAFFLENGVYTAVPGDLDVDITTAANFVVPPTVATVNPIASIRRTNAYWLQIDIDGTITCADAAPNAFTCAQAGY
jgi:prepilin-type N-terminal cleavage/methylation domain-containing protein